MVFIMRKFALILTKIIFKIFFRVEVINKENVPSAGPALLCANHNSMLDMFFLAFKLKRWVYWMAKEELFRNPIAAFVLRRMGAFPVRRGTGDVGSVKYAYKLLEQKEFVGIFPQGTRIDPTKIETTRVKPGAAMIAAKAGVPIIPAIVKGNYKIFSKMKVIYGEPFSIDKSQGNKYEKEELTQLSRDIIKKIYSLAEGI